MSFKNIKSELMKTNIASIVASPQERTFLLEENYFSSKPVIEKQTIVRTHVEKVINIDEKIIELVLKSGIDKVQPTAGFLVEVFSSGSDGKLFRLFKEDLVDLHGNILEQGFSDFFLMDLDK